MVVEQWSNSERTVVKQGDERCGVGRAAAVNKQWSKQVKNWSKVVKHWSNKQGDERRGVGRAAAS